ncbi:MFS transporter [Streptomyces sp. NPDC003860]
MAAVIASMLVSRCLASLGAARAYVVGFLVFGAGAVLNSLSPSLEFLILGRVVQGLGGGLLAGLGYAVIRGALPDRLWARAAGLISAMWGVGTLVGPALSPTPCAPRSPARSSASAVTPCSTPPAT